MDIFNAIAEPSRRSIIELLAKKGRLAASEIYEAFTTSAPAISQHLKVLREAQIVIVEKQGQQRMYKLDMNSMYEIERWAHNMTQEWNARLDRLDKVLKVKKVNKK
jgi:DNA-binding transcriptional ArsR family regulator